MQYNLQTPSARQLIKAAIAAAGRSNVVAKSLGVSQQAVHAWTMRGYVPAERIKPLCALGNNVVTPDQLLDAITRERAGVAE